MKDKITAVCVDMKAGDKTVLHILLDKDGTANRMGSGTLESAKDNVLMGMPGSHLFEKFMALVPEEIFQKTGEFKCKEIEGLPCNLTILFQYPGKTYGFIFHYGSDSEGPPSGFVALARAAIDITDPWYKSSSNNAQKLVHKTERPWWKFR